jgi:hypothetical protein
MFSGIVWRRGVDGRGQGTLRDLSEGVSHGLALESTVAEERSAIGFVLLSDDTTKE